MLFWMWCENTVNALFCIILKAPRVPETQGAPGFTVSLSEKAATSLEHAAAQK